MAILVPSASSPTYASQPRHPRNNTIHKHNPQTPNVVPTKLRPRTLRAFLPPRNSSCSTTQSLHSQYRTITLPRRTNFLTKPATTEPCSIIFDENAFSYSLFDEIGKWKCRYRKITRTSSTHGFHELRRMGR